MDYYYYYDDDDGMIMMVYHQPKWSWYEEVEKIIG
jgi:hypothetical protein